jgi:hypothetical protein
MPQGIKLMYLKVIVMCLKAPKRTQFQKTYVLESTESGVRYAKKITKYYEIFQNNPKIYYQKVYISHHFFPSFPFFFYYFYPLFCTFCPFLQIFDINTLNSIHNKDLQNILPRRPLPRRPLQTPQAPSKEFYPPKAENMQNKPNFNKLLVTSDQILTTINMQNEPNFTTQYAIQKYAKQTQFAKCPMEPK